MKTTNIPPKTRRQFLKVLSGCAASVAFGGLNSFVLSGAGAQSSPAQGSMPNVLLIVLDDLNDWVGCLGGNPEVKTPNMDRLARRGVLFTNAHCSAPLCNPSRASFFTGISPSTLGIYDNNCSFRSTMPNAVTSPQHFMAHGYRVVGGGKTFHHSYPDPVSWQEYFPSMLGTMRPDEPEPPGLPLNGMGDENFDWGPMDVVDDETSDAQVARWTCEELRKNHDTPFFIGVGIFRPHMKWYLPRGYFDRFPPDHVAIPTVNEQDLDDVPPMGVHIAVTNNNRYEQVIQYGQWHNAVAGYMAAISYADAQVGKVLDALDKSPYADNTIVVLWSDNGYHLGEKFHWQKQTLWEEATRCPLIIAAPGVTSAGGRCNRAVSLINVYPTLIDLCGLTPRNELEGTTLRPLLSNPEASWNHPAVSTWLYNNHSVRSDRYRYIRYSDGTEELYDHETDQPEWTNLAGDPQYAAIKTDLAICLPQINTLQPSP